MPDIEERFWRKYRDRGLTVVALDAHDQPEQVGDVQRFIDQLGVTYDVGLENTGTYEALVQNFSGLNPFPVDLVVDRDGTIAYIAREYDPDALTEIIEELLARQ